MAPAHVTMISAVLSSNLSESSVDEGADERGLADPPAAQHQDVAGGHAAPSKHRPPDHGSYTQSQLAPSPSQAGQSLDMMW